MTQQNEDAKPLQFVMIGRGEGWAIRERIVCVDGFTMSVQASHTHYCTPRTDDGPWTHVELGFPSARPSPWKTWKPFAESPKNPTGTVYGYVPVEMVAALVLLHGGVCHA